ncbi:MULTISPECIES: YdbH domain-containing protein [unclassified Shewanella]|uniref:YdbH domain-containing protein n=1 Tax=unclassified Shewanella TaxID=196818 RepID=UPI001BC3E6DB|nr:MULTISPECIES: YdbH domain-containing protein [unclassified Shewanella]GIU07726.1 C4-dicarboxylate ABC transporter [Shewanella sp. MBTL60-112-B1]GIU30349.1 C4-dicarboxylate ABC transporter [Shewanella sp. MBTL60-112-B2]
MAVVVGLALWHYERLTIDFANQFLADYQTQIHTLKFKPTSLTQWQVSQTELTVDNTEIIISDLKILLDKNTKPWAFKASDLLALSVADIEVKLAPSALKLSSQSSNEAGPTIGLNLDAFPEIVLDKIRISIKGLKDSSPTLELEQLSLNRLGELKSLFKVDQKPLFSLSAELNQKQWHTSTKIDLTLLQSFSRRLAAVEQSLDANQSPSAVDSNTSLLAPLYRLTQVLDDKHVVLDATLDSSATLNLKTAALTSQHSLQGTRLVLNDFAKLILQPSSLNTNLKPLGRLEFEVNGHIATPKLTVMPFELPISLDKSLYADTNLPANINSDKQLKRLVSLLNDKPFEQALSQLYDQLSLTRDTVTARDGTKPNLLLSFDEGLSYQIDQEVLSIPRVSLALKDSKLEASLLGSSLNYQSFAADDYQFSANWQLKAKHQQSMTLNRLWPKLAELPYRIEIDKASLNIVGRFSLKQTQQQASYTIGINSGALQQAEGITLSSLVKHSDTSIYPGTDTSADTALAASYLESKIGQTKLSIDSPVEYHYHRGQTQLTIPALSYQVTAIDGNLHLNNPLEENYKLHLDSANIKLMQAIPLMFQSSDKDNAKNSTASSEKNPLIADASFISQLLSHTLSNQVDINFTELSLDKSGYNRARHEIGAKGGNHKRRLIKQKLALFESIELMQKLQLKQQRVYSYESWRINDLYLTSQHEFTPEHNDLIIDLSRFNLIGDWQFNSEFAPILAFLSQTDSLPDSLDIKGNADLSMHYQLNRAQKLAFNLTLDPKVSDIQGSLNNLPFDGGYMDTQCKFEWQQDSANKRESAFNCDNITLSLKAFNPGVLITDIKAEAAIAFATQSAAESANTQASEQVNVLASKDTNAQNLALAQQLLGVKQASVGLTAQGNLLGGQLLIPQFQLNLKKPSSAYFVLQQIDLQQLLAIQPQVGIYADGIFDGVLPVNIEKGKASVKGGRLAARAPGGLIAIGNNPAVEHMRQSQPYLEFAFSALEHLNYSELSSSFDMDPLGNAVLKVNVKGRSRGIERPIHFNYSQEENMLQLLRSLQIGDNLQDQIERAVN